VSNQTGKILHYLQLVITWIKFFSVRCVKDLIFYLLIYLTWTR